MKDIFAVDYIDNNGLNNRCIYCGIRLMYQDMYIAEDEELSPCCRECKFKEGKSWI